MLASSYPRNPGDHSSIFLKNLCDSLYNNDVEIHVIAPASDGKDQQLDDRIPVHRFHYLPRVFRKLSYGSGILPNLRRNPLLWLTIPFFLGSMLLKLILVTRKTGANVIHCHWIIPQGIVALLSRPFHKAKIVVTAHGADAYAFRSGPARLIKKMVIQQADRWTANTGKTAEAVCDGTTLPSPAIIPMGINTALFKKAGIGATSGKVPEGTSVLLFVGRLVEKKGVSYLLEAFSMLPADVLNATRLWIVGDGHLRDQLEADSTALGISDQTTFWGYQSNDSLPDFFSAATIFVGPSIVDTAGDTEGQGVVFLEAFASGIPVIATTVGGIPEIIENGSTGLLVPPGNPVALREAILTLLVDSVFRSTLVKNARSKVEEKYDWEKVSQQFIRLYSDLLQRQPN